MQDLEHSCLQTAYTSLCVLHACAPAIQSLMCNEHPPCSRGAISGRAVDATCCAGLVAPAGRRICTSGCLKLL